MEDKPRERSIREVRKYLADIVNAAIQGRVTYITSRGRRVAAVVPLTQVPPDPSSCEDGRPAVTP